MTSETHTPQPYGLTTAQIEMLARPIADVRVQRDNKSRKHVQAWDVRRWLTRIFGYAGWSTHETSLTCVSQVYGEHPGDGHAIVTVVYRCSVRLTIRDPYGNVMGEYHGSATGDAPNFPAGQLADAHDFALKTADSQALKRAAVNLGDQFGLSLYNAGSTEAVVNASVAYGPLTPAALPANDVNAPEDEAEEAKRQIALQEAAAEQTGRGDEIGRPLPQHRRQQPAAGRPTMIRDDAPSSTGPAQGGRPPMTRDEMMRAGMGQSTTIPRKGPDAGERPSAATPNGRARATVWDVDNVLRNLDDCGEALQQIHVIRDKAKRAGIGPSVVRVPDRLLDEECIDKDGKPFEQTHYLHEVIDAAGLLIRRLCEASQPSESDLMYAAAHGPDDVQGAAMDALDRRNAQRNPAPR